MDATDAIIVANSPDTAEHLLVLDCPGLVTEALRRAPRVSVWCDDIRDARSVPSELLLDRLDPPALAGVDLVWLRLPSSLGALDEYAEIAAVNSCAHALMVSGGRGKHLNRSMNQTLASHFATVTGSLGQRKARALLARDPVPGPISWPRSRVLSADQLASVDDLEVWWHGSTFAAGRLDAGTRLLVQHLDQVAEADRYLDLGCGSGILATLLARANPDSEVLAVDASHGAVDATRRTASGTQVVARWADDLGWVADGSLDVVVCNPPFHRGTAKDSTSAFALFAEAARVLGEGGEFWCVFNSHLPWRNHLSRLIGRSELVAQDRSYTLTRSVQR